MPKSAVLVFLAVFCTATAGCSLPAELREKYERELDAIRARGEAVAAEIADVDARLEAGAITAEEHASRLAALSADQSAIREEAEAVEASFALAKADAVAAAIDAVTNTTRKVAVVGSGVLDGAAPIVSLFLPAAAPIVAAVSRLLAGLGATRRATA